MSQPILAGTSPSFAERRAYVRFPCGQAAFCCADNPRDYIFWTARARDISVSGIRLVVGHRFEPGTLLAVELLTTNQGIARQFPARVLHTTPHTGGGWAIGCEFADPLSEAELAALL